MLAVNKKLNDKIVEKNEITINSWFVDRCHLKYSDKWLSFICTFTKLSLMPWQHNLIEYKTLQLKLSMALFHATVSLLKLCYNNKL